MPDSVRLQLEATPRRVAPGGSITLPFRLLGAETQEEVGLKVRGLPEDWVSIRPNPITVPARGTASGSVTITPRTSTPGGTAEAGDYPCSVVAILARGAVEVDAQRLTLTVGEPLHYSLELAPPVLEASGPGNFVLVTRNESSEELTLDLTPASPAAVQFMLERPSVTLVPNEQVEQTLTVTPTPPVTQATQIPVRVDALPRQAAADPQSASATLAAAPPTNSPASGTPTDGQPSSDGTEEEGPPSKGRSPVWRWAVLIAALALLACCIILYILCYVLHWLPMCQVRPGANAYLCPVSVVRSVVPTPMHALIGQSASPSQTAPPPALQAGGFLELPFAYRGLATEFGAGSSADFRRALNRVTTVTGTSAQPLRGRVLSYFDHDQPLLPLRLNGALFGGRERNTSGGYAVLFDGTRLDNTFYSGASGINFSTQTLGGDDQTVVFAAADGVVADARYDERGAYVKINHEVDGVGSFQTIYWNLANDSRFENTVKKRGQPIQAGAPIGTMGRTARAQLHFEVRFARDRTRPPQFSADDVVDPFGFVPSQVGKDPWTVPSRYLWLHPTGSLGEVVDERAKVVLPGQEKLSGEGDASVCVLPGQVSGNARIALAWAPDPAPFGNQVGVGHSGVVNAVDERGNPVRFSNVQLSVVYAPNDVANVDPASLHLYRFDGGQWRLLQNETVDSTSTPGVTIITATMDQAGKFALLGQPSRDIVPPVTRITLDGPRAPSDRDGSIFSGPVKVTMESPDPSGTSNVGIQYSLDGGVTWNKYPTSAETGTEGFTSPLLGSPEVATASGEPVESLVPQSNQFLILARAVDNAGNVESLPAVRGFTIDPSSNTPTASPTITNTPLPTLTPTASYTPSATSTPPNTRTPAPPTATKPPPPPTQPPPPTLPPVLSFRLNPPQVGHVQGQRRETSQLQYTVQNVNNAVINGPGLARNRSVLGSGTITLDPDASAEYTVTVTQRDNSQQTILVQLPVVLLSADPLTPRGSDMCTTVRWQVRYAQSVQLRLPDNQTREVGEGAEPFCTSNPTIINRPFFTLIVTTDSPFNLTRQYVLDLTPPTVTPTVTASSTPTPTRTSTPTASRTSTIPPTPVTPPPVETQSPGLLAAPVPLDCSSFTLSEGRPTLGLILLWRFTPDVAVDFYIQVARDVGQGTPIPLRVERVVAEADGNLYRAKLTNFKQAGSHRFSVRAVGRRDGQQSPFSPSLRCDVSEAMVGENGTP